MPRTINFPLTFLYSESTPTDPVRLPRVPVQFLDFEDRRRFVALDMLVDSGADVTSVPAWVIRSLSIDIDLLEIVEVGGVGGMIQAYRHEQMPMRLGEILVLCPVVFITDLKEPLLGREAVFDRFCFAFEQHVWSMHVVESDIS